jgi:hypothetical protein
MALLVIRIHEMSFYQKGERAKCNTIQFLHLAIMKVPED